MFDEMHDIASQLVVKWARFGSSQKINVTDDFTRLTLNSIAFVSTCSSSGYALGWSHNSSRCAMDTRFNSFYKDELHPFVGAMVGMLCESGARAQRPAFASYFMRGTQRQYEADIELLKKVAGDVVAERRAHPSEKKELLDDMINGRDPKTGEALTDASIMNNMILFSSQVGSHLLCFYILPNIWNRS
jgi:cytochrome P450 / NADPH-cytochrome P450 reductase